MSNQQLVDQAFKLLHQINKASEQPLIGLKRERLANAKKRAYRRFLRRMGF